MDRACCFLVRVCGPRAPLWVSAAAGPRAWHSNLTSHLFCLQKSKAIALGSTWVMGWSSSYWALSPTQEDPWEVPSPPWVPRGGNFWFIIQERNAVLCKSLTSHPLLGTPAPQECHCQAQGTLYSSSGPDRKQNKGQPGSPSNLALSSAARGKDASITWQTGRLTSERGDLVGVASGAHCSQLLSRPSSGFGLEFRSELLRHAFLPSLRSP